MIGVDTRAEGSPASVNATAAWLRASLGTGLDAAGGRLAAARSEALAGFRGRAGAAYERHDVRLLRLVDDHAARVERAVDLFEAYAARLAGLHQAMAAFRERARSAGLTVDGTLIRDPLMAPAGLSVEALNLYPRLAVDVPAAHAEFVAWVEANLTSARDEFAAARVEEWAQALRGHLDGLGRRAGVAYAELTLAGIAENIQDRATELERGRRSGDPARRALALAPETAERADDLRDVSRLVGAGGKALGPLGTAVDTYSALESDKPAGGLLGVGAGAGASAGVIVGVSALAAGGVVSAPVVITVGATAVVGYGVATGVTAGWGALPDDVTDPADDWVSDRWDDTKGAAQDSFGAVKGWVTPG